MKLTLASRTNSKKQLEDRKDIFNAVTDSEKVYYPARWSDEGGENGDGKEGRELHGEWERAEIAWPLVCR